ncbi:MAG: hypothetical protein COU85_00880 [Candidatus Portnoybacteria bacterium CG10_big_fil_rev_8_21_14_0_10_44_7]|uniref:Uncharacterized protein n=1 Tax=Candidatus Portnoybacteria bacterium CG10_big_fil_rev_8_21_14_0_10_44_7 TaxID=1974816 RepID=A0A2M8KJ61_9BACT|nr:MAG: hypothetical protein COU85_00880 [Candidatus Portnoybacteria bacterium CG10_big_fil_rev_8_21_14_0_10_44_7]
MAEGGCGAPRSRTSSLRGKNSASPEPKSRSCGINSAPATLFVQSRSQQKSFLFLLPARIATQSVAGGEEKIGRAQKKCEENFFAGRAGFRHGGGTASLGILLKVGSSKVQNIPPKFILICLNL